MGGEGRGGERGVSGRGGEGGEGKRSGWGGKGRKSVTVYFRKTAHHQHHTLACMSVHTHTLMQYSTSFK